ncbi:hypothetical protein DY000_02001329 [Brassica cretica]|uniref:Uncharacterized protein n=1 Tax=Brassica cretica TaxID=69181 RepID=A0ABQ7C3J4_BRACR|nr:hypothetical protein DY000_02001329 [Brassica cretica]
MKTRSHFVAASPTYNVRNYILPIFGVSAASPRFRTGYSRCSFCFRHHFVATSPTYNGLNISVAWFVSQPFRQDIVVFSDDFSYVKLLSPSECNKACQEQRGSDLTRNQTKPY